MALEEYEEVGDGFVVNFGPIRKQENPKEEDDALQIVAFPFNTVQYLKQRLQSKTTALDGVKEEDIKLVYKGLELQDARFLTDYSLSAGAWLHWVVDQKTQEVGLYNDPLIRCSDSMQVLLKELCSAMQNGIVPRLTEDGTGASYMLSDEGLAVRALFKPRDEEAYAPNNPRGLEGPEETNAFKHGVYSTQQACREVAAFLLDRKFGNRAQVPETTMVHARHPQFFVEARCPEWKVGSLQRFLSLPPGSTAGDYASSVFLSCDVHEIGVLDIRMVNVDRNDSNILVRQACPDERKALGGNYRLVPVDHGLSLPDRLHVAELDVVWMSWPQAKQPFSEDCLAYIKSLDGEDDAAELSRVLGISKDGLRLMALSTLLLQRGAERGLTLWDIGRIMYRDDLETPSHLERAIASCIESAALAVDPSAPLPASLRALDLRRPMPDRRTPSTWDGSQDDQSCGSPKKRAFNGSLFSRTTHGVEMLDWEAMEPLFMAQISASIDMLVEMSVRSRISLQSVSPHTPLYMMSPMSTGREVLTTPGSTPTMSPISRSSSHGHALELRLDWDQFEGIE